MKKLFLVILGLIGVHNYNAYSQCSIPVQTGNPGLTPNWKCLPCMERGIAYDEVIRIENFDTIQDLIISQLRIDRLTGLPGGLHWSSNPSSAIFTSGGTGCINITGTTFDPAGTYQLGIYVHVWLDRFGEFGGEVSTLVNQLIGLGIIDTTITTIPNFDYFIRVIEPGENCDASACLALGTYDILVKLSGLTAQPNPFNNQTEVSWVSSTEGKFTAKIFDVAGKRVFEKEMYASVGANRITIKKGELSNGFYIFCLTNGNSESVMKLLISE